MMVLNSFDLWQKDAFFSAAEEVQESADVMESAYRMWLRERREGQTPGHLDELSRELQTALGTAKWQLEEFERAVRLSHGHGHHYDNIKSSRHRQFVAAIASQISHVEEALMEAFSGNGKQPLQWVNLDENERDDLAMFLSGTSQTSESSQTSETSTRGSLMENRHRRKYLDLNINLSRDIIDEMEGSNVTTRKDVDCIIDIKEKGTFGTIDDIICQSDKATGSRRTWSMPNFGALKIVIADEDDQSSRLMSSVEATPKEKGSKSIFWRRFKDRAPHNEAVDVFSQIFCRVGRLQRKIPNSLPLQLSRSIQLMLALILSIFLIMHFVLYTS